jgi:hypothetical protein
MKKYLIAALVLIATIALQSCKKESTTAPKDYTSSISNKNWWGTFNNAGESAQYYSVHFNADHSVLWAQMSGDYSGTWSLNGNRLTINFTLPTVTLTAEISDDNKLTNIITNTPNKVNNGTLIENPNVFLENSVWNVLRTHIPTDATYFFKFTFISNNKVFASGISTPFTYSLSPFGASIRINTITPYFGVITSGTEMRGNFGDADYRWQATKQ